MISLHPRLLATAVLPLLLAACAVNSPPKAPGELGREFSATIPGTWAGEISSGPLVCRMIKEYHRDGTARGVLLLKRSSGNVSLVMPEIPFTSRWRVVGDVVETYDIRTEVPDYFGRREVIKDTILSVSPERIVSKSVTSGRTEVIERLGGVR